MKVVFSFILNNIELIVAACGGIVALFQWRDSNNNRRAEYLDSLLDKLWENKDIQDFILLNDYDKDWYNEQFHRSDDKTVPTQADKTLSFMNYICYVVNSKIIRKKERALFDYYLSALALCKDMRCYLFDLYQYSILNNKPFLFDYFLTLCIKQGLLPKAFRDKNYFKYVMLKEDARNRKVPYNMPKQIVTLQEEVNTSSLFLHTCSRCEHCKNYKNSECQARQNKEDYFWLPEKQKNICSSFRFDENSWKK